MGTQPILKIINTSDDWDCETCGGSYADGCEVELWDGDKQIFHIGEPACAHCFDSSGSSLYDLLPELFEKLGYKVEITHEHLGEDCDE